MTASVQYNYTGNRHIRKVNFTVNREIKISVYGKRERQKLPRDHDFLAIFHVCRLPFAVCRFQREDGCFRVRQQREYLS